jgi:adenylate cyclase
MSEPELEAAGLLEGIDDEVERRERVELVEQLLRDGFAMEELKEAARRGRLGLLLVDRVLQREAAQFTSVDVAEQSELPLELLTRLWRALGLAETADDDVAYAPADVDAARTVANFRAAGLDEEPLVLISQVLGNSMSRLSDTLREVVGEALLQPGDSERTASLRWAQAAEHLAPMLTPLLGYVLAVHLKEQIANDIITREELVTGRIEGAREVTVCFADLVGFTRLGERVPPVDLSRAERLLTELALEVARPPLRLVKTIGDAAMLVSPEPEALVEAALVLVDEAELRSDEMPALRAGMASGPAISKRGDWFGAPVNLASRITDVARPGSVLATGDVHDGLRDRFAWSFAGKRSFRGVKSEVPLFRARRQPSQPAGGA